MIANITGPIGALFLRLLLMIVIPLVFSSLIVGVAGVGDVRKLGRIGLKSFGYTLILSAISVVIGLTLANTIRPGKRIDPTTATQLEQRYGSAASRTVDAAKTAATGTDSPLMQAVKTLVPSNPVTALAPETPNMLHLMFFALMIGIALTLIPASSAAPLMRVLQAIYEVTAKLIVHDYARGPLRRRLFDLQQYRAVRARSFTSALLVHGHGPGRTGASYVRRLFSIGLLSFADFTASILPTDRNRHPDGLLDLLLKCDVANSDPRFGRESGSPPAINRFVLTIGATANQNGTALYEGVTVLFLAQLAGVDLSFGQQLMVVYLAILGGVGTAGVPSGSIPFIVGVLATINVNPTLIAIILGVDRILDMCRTTLNVVGDLTIATYVARSEGYKLLQPKSAQSEGALEPAVSSDTL